MGDAQLNLALVEIEYYRSHWLASRCLCAPFSAVNTCSSLWGFLPPRYRGGRPLHTNYLDRVRRPVE
jgi:hypothetical protein